MGMDCKREEANKTPCAEEEEYSDWPNVAEGEGEEEDEVVVRTCVESSFVSTVEDAKEEEEGD